MTFPALSLAAFKALLVSAPMQDKPVRVAFATAIVSIASVATAIML